MTFFKEGENKEGTAVITDAESAVKHSRRKEETFYSIHCKSTLNDVSSVSVYVGVSLAVSI